MQTRFLLVLPLFIGAEFLVHQRLRLVVGQFIDRSVITEAVLPTVLPLVLTLIPLEELITKLLGIVI